MRADLESLLSEKPVRPSQRRPRSRQRLARIALACLIGAILFTIF
jgi:hypothetical protein